MAQCPDERLMECLPPGPSNSAESIYLYSVHTPLFPNSGCQNGKSHRQNLTAKSNTKLGTDTPQLESPNTEYSSTLVCLLARDF
jgi:hypothetical protein